jgi:hypothetical protein
MKRILLITVMAVLVFTAVSATWYVSKLHHHTLLSYTAVTAPVIDNASEEKISSMAGAAKQYAARNRFNTQYCFLVDMSIASGRQRFFVYDTKNNKVLMNGMVTHGCCNQRWLAGRQYGNDIGCGCTSLGKYKIGHPYQGKFGLAYKLYGLDATNSNAYSRFVVLHALQCVPEKETTPYPVCQSDGCPAVSPGFLQQLAPLINNSKQPVLLWIYE